MRSGTLLSELLGEPDENPFGASDVAEPIRLFVLDHFTDELRAALAEPGERIVDVLHREHDAQVTESVHRSGAVIGDHRRRQESGHLEPAVTVWRTHHGNLDAHIAQSSDTICPLSLDWRAPFELEPKFRKELNGGVHVFYDDADIVHTLDRHDLSFAPDGRGEPRQPPPGADLPAAPRCTAPGLHSRTYLARFQTNSSVSPAAVRGLVNFSSSAVSEVMTVPIMFANVLPSTLGVMTLSTSLIEYVP